MAEKKTIELEVKSNLGGSISELKALKKELKNASAGSDEFKKIYNQIDDLEDKIKSAKNKSSDWVDSLEQAGGPLGMVGAAINKAKVATQSFGGALKATGIGLIVSLVAGLAVAFSENEDSMKKLQPLLDGLSKIFQGVFRAVEPLFNTLVDLAMKALPYVTKGIGMVYSAMMAYFTFLKESGSGALKILKGIFTLDTDTIKDGMDQIGGSFKKTATSYKDSLKRFTDGSKELTKSEKLSAEERAKIREKEIADREAKAAKQKEIAEKLAKLEKERFTTRQAEIDAFNAKEAELQAERDAAKTAKDDEKNKIDFSKGMVILQARKALTDEEIADAKRKADEAIQLEKDKVAAKQQALSDITSIFGAESAIGKAALVAKQILNAKELLMDAGKTLGFINLKAAESTVAITGGAAKTASVGFPQNIPLLIGYAAQAAGIFSAIKSAVKAAKGSVSTPNIATSGGAATAVSQAVQAAPQFNVVGTSGANQIAQTLGNQAPIKAFVVANDVTTQASLDRNIVKTATLGG